MSEERLKQPKIFIDTQDMEERYGEELYKDYLERENKELKKKITFNEKSRRKMQQSLMEQIEDYKSRIDKAIKYIEKQYELIKDSDEKWQPVLDNKKILNILNGRE